MRRAIPFLAVAVLVAGCGSSSTKKTSSAASAPAPAAPSAAPAATSVAVKIKNFLFVPATINVKAGGTVTWTNEDSSEHTATPDSGTPFADTGTLTQNKSSKAIVFKTPGTYAYHCAFHAFMHGSVVVSA